MLTPKQLALIRAALTYFDEELSPHGTEAISDYIPEEVVTPAEVAELRDLLDRCELQYAACDETGRQLVDTQLWDVIPNLSGRWATVLVPPR